MSAYRKDALPPRRKNGSLKTVVTFALFGSCCFYAGILVGAQTMMPHSSEGDCSKYKNLETMMASRIQKQATQIEELDRKLRDKGPAAAGAMDTDPRFPNAMAGIANGMAAVDRTGFAHKFDMGVPLDDSKPGNENVLLLYSDPSSLPTSDASKGEEAKSNTKLPLIDDLDLATENCDKMNVILTQPGEKGECFAFMGQYRSFHLQKWMRLPGGEKDGEKLDHNAPLRLVNRGAQVSGRKSAKVPSKDATLAYWETLRPYLNNLQATLDELKPIAEKVAKDNTVVVMVCNHGQSELLMNFVCAAKARGLDISPILVFATDQETTDLAEGLGLAAFFDEKNYGKMPKEAAARYADRTFTAMMMAKVYCVQMISMLGYDLLFQDVDLIWYKNPLEYFHDKSSPVYDFDIYFQDDGSRGLFYAPYSANTGFYYVRQNDRTRYFFNSLLLAGDLISSTHSHQIALISLLSEHASMYGLKVKVLSRDGEEFPGGFSFHKRHEFMKDIFAGKVQPYLFHMSWTKNKDNKQKFFKQLGGWYLEDKCAGSTASEILEKNGNGADAGAVAPLQKPCCLAEPAFSCFYKDKPSMKACKDSPVLDKGAKSFW